MRGFGTRSPPPFVSHETALGKCGCRLLLNLVGNAVKYSQPGGNVAISLKLLPDAAVLDVSNPGPGIPPELKGRIFERFFRVDPSHDQRIEGSGLGLNITQWIARKHGGDISLETGADGLTRATVRLPGNS